MLFRSATDKLLGSVRDGAEDLRKEVDGAIVVHASRTTTKMSMAEKNAAKAQSDAYLQSLATKYNGKPAIQAPRSGVTFDAPKSKVKEERTKLTMKSMKLTTAGRVVIFVIVLALLAGIGGFGYNYYKNNIADDKPISSGTQSGSTSQKPTDRKAHV